MSLSHDALFLFLCSDSFSIKILCFTSFFFFQGHPIFTFFRLIAATFRILYSVFCSARHGTRIHIPQFEYVPGRMDGKYHSHRIGTYARNSHVQCNFLCCWKDLLLCLLDCFITYIIHILIEVVKALWLAVFGDIHRCDICLSKKDLNITLKHHHSEK